MQKAKISGISDVAKKQEESRMEQPRIMRDCKNGKRLLS
jgi:hypothetical protein